MQLYLDWPGVADLTAKMAVSILKSIEKNLKISSIDKDGVYGPASEIRKNS